jgi:hypothetical protein
MSTRAKAPAKPKNKILDKKAKVKCRGTVKSSGLPCTKFAQPDTHYCSIHTPGYKRGVKVDNKAVIIQALERLNTIVELREKLGIYKVKPELNIQGDPLSEFVSSTWVDDYVKKCIGKFIAADKDNFVLDVFNTVKTPQDQFLEKIEKFRKGQIGIPEAKHDTTVLPFGRRHWQKVGWLLENDRQSYANLALTCKSLYQILCLDKVYVAYHPLRYKIMHPLLFMMPCYRVVKYDCVDCTDEIFREHNIPTLTELIEFDLEKVKSLETRKFMQYCGDMMQDTVQELMKSLLGKKDRYEPSIPDGGIFEDVKERVVVSAGDHDYDFVPKHIVLDFLEFSKDSIEELVKVVRAENSTWLIAKSSNIVTDRILHKKLRENLVGYDGRLIIRLMR